MGISLDEQAVQVEWKVAQISAKALKELIQQLLENRNKITHGEQKFTKLNLQGKKLESVELTGDVPFPVSWTVKMKKKQKETQDILSYHTQAAGCSDKARAKASGGRQPIEECGRTGL